MTRQRIGRVISRRAFFAGVTLVFFLSGGASPGAEETGNNERLLVALLAKTRAMIEKAEADLQAGDRELELSERTFQEAERKMTIAIETRNDQAGYAAREPLRKAREERDKLKKTKARLELTQKTAESSTAAVRNLLVSGQGQVSDKLICGLASLLRGKATVLRKDGTKAALTGGRPLFIEPGDEILTGGGSNAEVLGFDGRAVVQLAENSQLRLEEDGPQELVLRLLQGNLYAAVDNYDVFAGIVQTQARNFETDQKLNEAFARAGDQFEKLTDKRLTVRTPGACCSVKGAYFTVELIGSGGTGISIFEGAVDGGDADCAKQVRLEQGSRVTVTKAGISEPRKLGDVDRWWER